MPYRLDYVVETGEGFVTTLLDASSRGAEWSRTLILRRDGAGSEISELIGLYRGSRRGCPGLYRSRLPSRRL